MSNTAGNILLLADDGVAGRLAKLTGPDRFTHRSRPYEALAELARRSYDTLVVAEGYPDLPGLTRAVRRLGRRTRIFALCSPAGEAQLRGAGLEELGDYFIFPPTAEELDQIFRAPPMGMYEPVRGDQPPELPSVEVAGLIEAAATSAGLAEHIRQLAARWSGTAVRWADAGDSTDAGEPLLLAEIGSPKVLLAEAGVEPPAEARRRLEALQVLIPSLSAQARRTETLHRLAITDFLTGAYNRRYFYRFTDELLRRARDERSRVTLLLYDIDDFKHYNDTYGHAAGDEILRETAQLMKQVTRDHDVVARIGGDEFAVLFWDAEPPRRPDSQHPHASAELTGRFVEAISTHEFASLGAEAKGVLTISGGLATFPWDGRTCRDLLRRADGALHEAKKSGKGMIHIIGQGNISATPPK